MPREIIHWLVLEQSLAKLPQEISQLLQANWQLAQLGAISHDAPYYFRFGKDPRMSALGEELHGNAGEDTLAVVKFLLGRAQAISEVKLRQGLQAFTLGMLSHCVTDWTFHPLVFYFTGDYYHSDSEMRRAAQGRHRALEVFMDSYFEDQLSDLSQKSISKLLINVDSTCPATKLLIAKQLGAAFPNYFKTSDEVSFWNRAWLHFAVSQLLIRSSLVGLLLQTLYSSGLRAIRQYQSLCRFGKGPARLFDQAQNFKNPLSGEEKSLSLKELLGCAVIECTELIKLCMQQEPLPQGKSLIYGLPNCRASDGRFFSSEGLDLNGLRINAG